MADIRYEDMLSPGDRQKFEAQEKIWSEFRQNTILPLSVSAMLLLQEAKRHYFADKTEGERWFYKVKKECFVHIGGKVHLNEKRFMMHMEALENGKTP